MSKFSDNNPSNHSGFQLAFQNDPRTPQEPAQEATTGPIARDGRGHIVGHCSDFGEAGLRQADHQPRRPGGGGEEQQGPEPALDPVSEAELAKIEVPELRAALERLGKAVRRRNAAAKPSAKTTA